MAHYALLDQNNLVVRVITGKDEDEGEHDWELFYSDVTELTAKRTSYNTRCGVYFDQETGAPSSDQTKVFRKNFAGIGFTYDPVRDAFIPPKPSADATLDETTCQWIVPSLGADSV